MFIGHYGLAFALKRADPKVSLGTLFVSVQFVDILWTVFILLGWERARIEPGLTAGSPIQYLYYPWSHSLGAGLIWGLLAAAVIYSRPTKDTSHRLKAAVVVGVAVASHWILDVVVHIRDLPVWSDSGTKVGLGLWDHPTASILVELALVGIGAVLYATHRTRRHPLHPARLAILIGVLVILEIVGIIGPPPPNLRMVAVLGLLLYMGLAWLAAWEDRAAPAPAERGKGKRH